jgi:hypothetical protein
MSQPVIMVLANPYARNSDISKTNPGLKNE